MVCLWSFCVPVTFFFFCLELSLRSSRLDEYLCLPVLMLPFIETSRGNVTGHLKKCSAVDATVYNAFVLSSMILSNNGCIITVMCVDCTELIIQKNDLMKRPRVDDAGLYVPHQGMHMGPLRTYATMRGQSYPCQRRVSGRCRRALRWPDATMRILLDCNYPFWKITILDCTVWSCRLRSRYVCLISTSLIKINWTMEERARKRLE